MSVLQPYIDAGSWSSRAGRPTSRQVAILRWDGTAQKRMEDLLTSDLQERQGRRVLSPYDGMSIGILSALKSDGYGTASKPLPGRHRPGRRARLGEVDHRR
jgi:putative multiple sugar transport system substrate-binding protein